MLRHLRSAMFFLITCTVFAVAAAWSGQDKKSDNGGDVLPVLKSTASKFWKGNLHTHSLWSDGDDFPEMIADWYKRQGYHFLSLTDHNLLSEGERWIDLVAGKSDRGLALKKYLARFGSVWVEQREQKEKQQVRLKPLAEFRNVLEEPGRFMLIPGEEITHKFAKNPIHMNAINLRDPIKPIDGASVAETIQANHRQVAEQIKKTKWKTLTSFNHPNWGWGATAEDMIAATDLRFFEIHNGHPGVKNYGDETHASVERMWDILLAHRLGKQRLPLVFGLATDDAHAYHAFGVGKVNPGRGWIMVRASYLSAEAMVRAMEAGDFYCSSGVTLTNVRRAGDKLSLVIQPEKGVTYKTQFIGTLRDASLESQPRLDDKGQPLPVTRVYGEAVGRVLAEADGLEPSYRLTGQELYVRARVVSTRPHPNPYQKGDVEMAWTQPVAP